MLSQEGCVRWRAGAPSVPCLRTAGAGQPDWGPALSPGEDAHSPASTAAAEARAQLHHPPPGLGRATGFHQTPRDTLAIHPHWAGPPLPPWPLALPQGKDPAKGPGQLGAHSTPGRLQGSPCSQMASRPHAQPQPGSRSHRHGYHRAGRLWRPEERKELRCVTPEAQPLRPVASSARCAAHLPEQTARAHTRLSAWPGLAHPAPDVRPAPEEDVC